MSTEQETTKVQDTAEDKYIFAKAIDWYIIQINSLMDTIPIVLNILSSNTIMRVEKINEFSEQHGLDKLKVGESANLSIESYKCYERLNSNMDKAIEAMRLYPCNMVVSFVSMYDAFLGNIIKAIYKTVPDQLKDCNREISINEILQFESIDDAKERIIEKEVESVIRNSHSEQLDWFKNKLKCPFKDFATYGQFIEITERRNLFVHTDGIVSRQYISVCKENGVDEISKIKVGDKLDVTPDYLTRCYNVLFEVGVKLGIIVWRKLRKGDEKADYYLNTICYNLLKQERYGLAKTMLHFATDVIKNPANEEVRRMFIINKALAYYLSGEKNTCKAILDKEDWSASTGMFQLAIEVLKENYKLAADKMESAKSDFDSSAYYEWPLFNVFRESDEFKSKYEELFGQGFEYKEPKKENIEEILRYAMDIQAKAETTIKEDIKEAVSAEECVCES